jgi:type II secretory pathway pseudopilin PulG
VIERVAKKQIKKPESNGFATVELIITLIVIGIIFSAFITTFVTIQNINKKAKDIHTANSLAFEKLQIYESLNFTGLPDTDESGVLEEVEDFDDAVADQLPKPSTARVYINEVSPTLKQVVVTVEFGEDPTRQILQYATFIQRQGLGQ